MLNITRRDIEEAHNYARDEMRSSRDPDNGKSFADKPVVTTVLVASGAAAVGVLTGRFGPLHFGGNPVPLDLAAAVAVHLAGFVGKSFGFGSVSPYLHHIADGALAGYVTKFGVGVGTEMRKKAGEKPLNLADISGEDGRRSPAQLHEGNRMHETRRNKGPMTEAELAAMAQAVR